MKLLLTWITGVTYAVLGCTVTSLVMREVEKQDWYYTAFILFCSISLTFIGIKKINKATL